MVVYSGASSMASLPACHLTATQITNSFSGDLNSKPNLSSLASTTAIASITTPLNRYNSIESSRSSVEFASIVTSKSSNSKSTNSADRIISQSTQKDPEDCTQYPSSPKMSQMTQTDPESTGVNSRSRRVRKLTSKALDLHNENGFRYYTSSAIDQSPKNEQNVENPQSAMNSRSSTPGILPGSKRKRNASSEREVNPISVEGLKRKQEKHSIPAPEAATEQHNAQIRLDGDKNNDIVLIGNTESAAASPREEETLGKGMPQPATCTKTRKIGLSSTKGPEIDHDLPSTKRSTRSSHLPGSDTSPSKRAVHRTNTAHTINSLSTPATPTHMNRGLKVILSPKESACFITLRVPSTRLRQFQAGNLPNHNNDPDNESHAAKVASNKQDAEETLNLTASLDSDIAQCHGSCVKAADPGLLLFMVAKVMVDMDGDGAEDEDEDDDDFDVEEYQSIMKKQCICRAEPLPPKQPSFVRPASPAIPKPQAVREQRAKVSKITKRKQLEVLKLKVI